MSHMWKQTLALPLVFCFALAALLLGLWWAQTQTNTAAGTPAELSEPDVTQRALAVAQNNYSGTPAQVTVKRTTVGALGKFQCSALSGMVSFLAAPLQRESNLCASDSTLWVVSLRGEFHYKDYTTNTLQVVLDRDGNMLSIDSAELVSATTPGY